MSQKFISLDDAAAKLGLSKEKLNELREAGDLRAYRDGASWKFRTEEIDKLEAEGGADEDANDQTVNLGDDFELDMGSAAPIDPPEPEAAPSEPAATASDDDSDPDDIGLGVEPLGDGDDAESILLTGDQDLEGGIPRPQSTIIGKSELSLEDDLQLAGGSDASDLAPPEVKPAEKPAEPIGDLDDLELDLAGSSDELAVEKPEAEEKPKADETPAAATSDLELEELELDLSGSDLTKEDSPSGSDILGGQEPKAGADLSSAGSVAGLSGIDAIDLADDEDDDLVLGGSDDDFGSASGGDSGINLSPSDSGFALDEVPLDLGGSAIGSALDLASLSAASAASGISGLGSAASGVGDFQLTPDDASEEEDSSQIVALEDVGEEEDEDVAGFEPDDDGGDFGAGLASGIGAGAAPAPAVVGATQEIPFPGWVIGLLACGFFSMLLAGIMAMDLMQSMWAWDEPYTFSSSLMEGLLSLVGG